MSGRIFFFLILLSNFSFCQINSDSLTCSYYQDDLRLMNSLIDYQNTRLTQNDSGIIYVVINLNSDGLIEYSIGFARNISNYGYQERFDSFLFGSHIVVVITGLESPYMYDFLDRKKKLLLSKYVINKEYFETRRLRIFDKYKYFYLCSSSKPKIIKESFLPLFSPCSIAESFKEYPVMKFENPMKTKIKKSKYRLK